MKMSKISINANSVGERATELKRVGNSLMERSQTTSRGSTSVGLSKINQSSTVSAESNIQDAIQKSLTANSTLAEALITSGEQIRNIGDGFAQIDKGAAKSFNLLS